MSKLFRKCPVCLYSESEILYHQKFVLPEKHILPNNYNVVCCNQCSFVYADTVADQSKYDLYYAEFSKYEDTEVSSGGISEWELNRYERILKDVSKYIQKESTIIDIGCANGGLLSYFKMNGYSNITGLDPSITCVNYVLSQGINAIKGDMFDNPLIIEQKKYDLVIFSHVFEHLYDLKKSMEYAAKYLSENGILYIEVPNAAGYKDFYKVPYYYFDLEHINHFTTCSLNNLVLQSNFEFVESAEKEIPVSLNENYPAIYGIYRKKEMKDIYNLIQDELAKKSILEYIELSKFKAGYEELLHFSKLKIPIIVWGAGQYTLRLLHNTPLKDCNIVAFIDNDKKKQGQQINQVQIHSPAFLEQENFKGPIIIVSALFSHEICQEIRALGLNNQLVEVR